MTDEERTDTRSPEEPGTPVPRRALRWPRLGAPPKLRLRLPPASPPVVYAALALISLGAFLIFFTSRPGDEPEPVAGLLEQTEGPIGMPAPENVPQTVPEVIEAENPPLPPDMTAAAEDVTESLGEDDTAPPDETETDETPTPPPWEALDNNLLLDQAAVARFTTLPRRYAWPLPWARSRVICHTNPDAPHIHMLQSPEGRLYHWGDAARYVREINTAHGISSTEVATVSPTAFLEPLRAAGQQLCATRDTATSGSDPAAEDNAGPTPAYTPVNALPFDLPEPPPTDAAGRPAPE